MSCPGSPDCSPEEDTNIDSLAVGETDKHDVSSMTIVSTGDERTIDQIEKQLNKKPDVIKVRRLEEVQGSRALEMMMIKVSYSATNRASIEPVQCDGREDWHVTMKYMIIELAKELETLDEFVMLCKPYGILEVQRTGTIMSKK